jgi:lipoprotein-anchoring transpeptidase ErfK/SrfK
MNNSFRRVVQSLLLVIVLGAFVVAPVLADQGTHIVRRGETLFRIALKYGVTVDALRAANGIVGTRIYAGQVLIIPDRGAPVAAAPAASAPSSNVGSPGGGVHVVQRGENLFRIGLRYGVSWQAIMQANGLGSTNIYVGQRLTIPGGNGAAASAAPASSPAAAPPGDGRRFLVDLSEQRLYAYEGNTLMRSTLISSGLPQFPTVIGTYNIYVKYRSARMRGPGYDLAGVPYVMYFYKGYGLHGTYWHNNFGQPMSHGCVNMPTSEAEWAYNWASIGTPVTVQY